MNYFSVDYPPAGERYGIWPPHPDFRQGVDGVGASRLAGGGASALKLAQVRGLARHGADGRSLGGPGSAVVSDAQARPIPPPLPSIQVARALCCLFEAAADRA